MSRLRSAARQLAASVRDAGPLWTASLIADRLLPLGILGAWPDRTVMPDALAGQLEAILRAWGMAPEHVAITVRHILYADLHGIDSHGASMLLDYHRRRLAGALTMTPAIGVVRETAATALVDGGGGLGHVPADVAMRLAIAKCGAGGIGAVAVRNSGHFGAAGAYTAMAAEAGYVGIATTNTREPAVVPTHGAEAKLGTNPIAFGAPAARNPPFMLDMATSTASVGKVTTAWRRGRSIPAGWALDPRGKAVTSGRLAAKYRRLTPLGATAAMGSHKGYGLAAAVEILSAVLPGRGGVGHFFLALDPACFRAHGSFAEDLDVLLDGLRTCAPIDAAEPVRVAGDPEQAAHAARRRDGIPVSRSVIEDLRTVARATGVPFTLAP
ncbi:MAG TPA: Ldh family oxidoreductase [Candidatus Binatia bacterium]|nr:Ldh family oxidoreductase [Candidatus Binatia bacterium]